MCELLENLEFQSIDNVIKKELLSRLPRDTFQKAFEKIIYHDGTTGAKSNFRNTSTVVILIYSSLWTLAFRNTSTVVILIYSSLWTLARRQKWIQTRENVDFNHYSSV
ncbi:hypothetical protein QE152_g21760 [Popillia japonica]|uniref:Uncharacterized protein n=1 Tax=Popillia japonica TaxID=7064 RepID=A0AAW1KL21_POPJA